jgi:hypothetical protein
MVSTIQEFMPKKNTSNHNLHLVYHSAEILNYEFLCIFCFVWKPCEPLIAVRLLSFSQEQIKCMHMCNIIK